MAYHLRFTPNDLLRCRFAISPLWETVAAVRALHDPAPQTYHQPWLQKIADRAPYVDLLPVIALQPRRGWCPDLLTPVLEGPGTSIDDELAKLRTTDPATVTSELSRTLADQPDPAHRLRIRLMLDDPAGTRDLLADRLRHAWKHLVEPYWPRVRDLLDADIAHRMRLLAEGGLERLVPSLDSRLSWKNDTLTLTTTLDEKAFQLRGSGLVLMPSAFNWPQMALLTEVADQSALSYPARGVGWLWQRAEASPNTRDALGRLMGASRARILAGLGVPATTTVLAERYALSASNISGHLAVLRDAGLVTSRRHRYEVYYERTALGDAVLGGSELGGGEDFAQ